MTVILKTSDGLQAVIEIPKFQIRLSRAMKKLKGLRLQGGDYEQRITVIGIRQYLYRRTDPVTDTLIYEEVTE